MKKILLNFNVGALQVYRCICIYKLLENSVLSLKWAFEK